MAVAAVWWDIYDVAAPSEAWDVLNNSLIAPNGGIWKVLTDANYQSGFAQFWTGWKLNVGRHLCEVSTIMQENDIDLGNPQPYTISVVSCNLALGSTTVIYPGHLPHRAKLPEWEVLRMGSTGLAGFHLLCTPPRTGTPGLLGHCGRSV